MSGDAAISVFDSSNTQVVFNSLLVSGTYPTPIEYRFTGTTGVLIAYNLLDGSILARDGATGTVSDNYVQATAALFVNPPAGDLHLRSTAAVAIDRVTTPLTNCSTDWDGQPRPFGAAYDLGADEYRNSALRAPRDLRILK